MAVHINRLREKIEQDPAKPRYIQAVWGTGLTVSRNAFPSGRSLCGRNPHWAGPLRQDCSRDEAEPDWLPLTG